MNKKQVVFLIAFNLFALAMLFFNGGLGIAIFIVETIVVMNIVNPPKDNHDPWHRSEDEVTYKRLKPVNRNIKMVPRAPAPKKPVSKPRFQGAHLNRMRSRQFETLSQELIARQNQTKPPRAPKALTATFISLTALALLALSYRETITLEGENALKRTSLLWGNLPLGEESVSAESPSGTAPFETAGNIILLAEGLTLLITVLNKTFHPASADLMPETTGGKP